MAGRKRWVTRSPTADGLWTIELSSWKHFHDFIHQQMLHYSHYVWRGQADSSWKLETSLDRALKGKRYSQRPELVAEHLERFKSASRGRRGPVTALVTNEDDWWALGQHNGLATPLLDWTESPFVALYFAFERKEKSSTEFRSVWALANVEGKNQQIRNGHIGEGQPPLLGYVRPFQDDNARLVTQSGLFTRVPVGTTVDSWIQENCRGEKGAFLIHLKVPEKDRADCMCTLNRMNISHKSLFPDLFGSAEHCNKALAITDYCPPSGIAF